MPDDLQLFVRMEADIPFTMKDEIQKYLIEKNWNADKIAFPDPTMLDRMVRRHE
jgi:acetyl-CoA decarbonylase/synthase complex subunit alpha